MQLIQIQDYNKNTCHLEAYLKGIPEIISPEIDTENLILKEKLKLNNKIIKSPSKKVCVGDFINLQIPEPETASLKPYKFKLEIVYEDKDLLIIDKPAGIIMHPGAGNYDRTIVNALINYNKNSLSNAELQIKILKILI